MPRRGRCSSGATYGRSEGKLKKQNRNIGIVGAIATLLCASATAQTLTTVHSFTLSQFSDGLYPYAMLVLGSDGNFYGTTGSGGAHSYGTVFRIGPDGSFTNLYSFKGSPSDGAIPQAALVEGSDGNFYGTTARGGTSTNCDIGCGTVYVMSPTGSVTVLHSFSSAPGDGSEPVAGLVQGSGGNFYGTTTLGGANDYGTVFQIGPGGGEMILYSFSRTDGAYPQAALVEGSDGNFYGTTLGGGTSTNCDIGCGTVFMISPSGSFTSLYSFNLSDGALPSAELVRGSNGTFYGTTQVGGPSGAGVVFNVSPVGILTTLHSFGGAPRDGDDPSAGLVQGNDGNLYGTTAYGGASTNCSVFGGAFGCGTVFVLSPSGTLTRLNSFNGSDGSQPEAGLVQGSDGNFYGTTVRGGAMDFGTVFKLSFGASCIFSIDPTKVAFSANGVVSNVTVTASATDCVWAAGSNDGFITITSGTNGVGSGLVSYSVAGNCSSGSRTGTITIAGLTFTVTQAAPGPDLTGVWSNVVQTCKLKQYLNFCKVKGSLIVQNIGDADAHTSFVRYYLSTNDLFGVGDTLLKQVATGKVKLDKPKKKTLSARLPIDVNGSGLFILAVIDADNTVSECDEENNIVVFGPLP